MGVFPSSVPLIRSILRHPHGRYYCSSRRLVGKRNAISEERSCFAYKNVEIHEKGGLPSYVISRALCAVVEPYRGGPLVEYERRIAKDELSKGDSCQIGTVNKLQTLYEDLFDDANRCKLDRYYASEKSSSSWFWSRLLQQSSYSPVKGLYLYGGVGTGKTMLMDLFFTQLPSYWRKKRIHFHDFMLVVHSRLQKHKGGSDPIQSVAAEIANESVILCLDEFMVTDLGVAMILNRLFEHLFRHGVILVATSNCHPDGLYEGGLHRDISMPFIAALKERCVVQDIASSVDYRLLNAAEQGFYFIGKDLSGLVKAKFQELVGKEKPRSHEVELVMGRTLKIHSGANGCAYFGFDELCDRPLGAADYLGLFKKFHTVALEGVPIFGLANRAAAYRFVTLLDVMYENKARLVCSAEGSPEELFQKIRTIAQAQKREPGSCSTSRTNDDADLCVDNKLAFAKYRTISRLTEMNSKAYLQRHIAANKLA